MKKTLAGLLLFVGLIILMYGSVKLARADEDGTVKKKIDGIEYTIPSPNEELGKSSVNIGLICSVAGLLLFFIPIGRKKNHD